ncbi:EHN domain-containing protein [Mycena indigotica]|uniref:EHN domain-containing protein n=1 Tax=Mycena indigotica TaxID=2126181 RepID=A0A8H6SIQ4_9AGAR|nr:EHN domain-containing protein [Mycena indigotica]KAF7299505.1 EHN domain-containing protein [Mycena indigotica]
MSFQCPSHRKQAPPNAPLVDRHTKASDKNFPRLSPPMAEAPFVVAVPDTALNELRQKLALSRLPDEIDEAGWTYGVPLSDIRRLLQRWQEGFDWRAHEEQINAELPQFTRDIDVEGFGTLNIHYVHQKSQRVDAIPLLFVHGWPGSFLEVRKILPLLVDAPPEHPAFHVVALSLPGFGFSEAPKKKGFKLDQYAEVGNKLMIALGYSEYVTQGGDLGFSITRRIAQKHGSQNAKAWHTNFPIAHQPPFWGSMLAYIRSAITPWSPFEKAGRARTFWFVTKGRGYYHAQSTKPQTLGYSLADSPVGLLAWVYEKLVEWTDNYAWEDDEGALLLAWVTSYYFSRAGPAASLRIYYELHHGEEQFPPPSQAPKIPFGTSFFPKEVAIAPRTWTRPLGNCVFEAEHTKGGHFAAHEVPELLVDDVRKMFGKGGPAFGVVSGKTGY